MARVIGVKLSDDDLEKYERATRRDGARTIAGWLRGLAERSIAPPPDLAAPVPRQTITVTPHPAKRTAAEIAAMIPGVRLGLEAEPPEPQAPADVATESTEPLWDEPPLPKFNWAAKFALWKSHGDEGDGEMKEFLAELNLPKTFWALRDSRYRLAWLEENRPNG